MPKRARASGEKDAGASSSASSMKASVKNYAKAARKAAREAAVEQKERSRSRSRPAASGKAKKAKKAEQPAEEKKGKKSRTRSAGPPAGERASKRSRKRAPEPEPEPEPASEEEEEEDEDNGPSAALFFVDKVGNRSKKVRALQKELQDVRRKEKRKERKDKQKAKRGSAMEVASEDEDEEEEEPAVEEVIAEGARVGIDVPLPKGVSAAKRRRLRKKVKAKMIRGGVRPASAPVAGISEERLPAAPVAVDDVPFDPWADDAPTAPPAPAVDEADALMRPAAPKRNRRLMDKLIVRKGLEVAAPGHSANPLPEAHQEVLREAHEFDVKEKEAERELRMKLNGTHPRYKVTRKFPKGADADDNGDDAAARPVVRPEDRLTQTDRNRLERRRAAEREQEERKRHKEMLKEAGRAPEVAAEVDRELAEREAARKAAAERYVPREPRLGKDKLEGRFPDAAMSEDLQGSMRTVPVVDSVAAVQFRRLQERRLIEPRMPHKRHRGHGLKKGFKSYKVHKDVEFA